MRTLRHVRPYGVERHAPARHLLCIHSSFANNRPLTPGQFFTTASRSTALSLLLGHAHREANSTGACWPAPCRPHRRIARTTRTSTKDRRTAPIARRGTHRDPHQSPVSSNQANVGEQLRSARCVLVLRPSPAHGHWTKSAQCFIWRWLQMISGFPAACVRIHAVQRSLAIPAFFRLAHPRPWSPRHRYSKAPTVQSAQPTRACASFCSRLAQISET